MKMEMSELESKNKVEVCAGRTKLILINRNFLEVITEGDYEVEDALLVKEVSLKLTSEADNDLVVLADMSRAGKSSVEARQVWNELNDYNKDLKIALTGIGAVARVLASFALAFTHNKNVKFFATREEALKWLGKAEVGY